MKIISVLFVFIFFFSSFAQINWQTISFQHLSSDQGLANSFVRTMEEDSSGYIWFGTDYGLSRYDGYDFQNYFPIAHDSNSISDVKIMILKASRRKGLWVGTYNNGLNYFDYYTEKFRQFIPDSTKNSIPGNIVIDVLELNENEIWVACWQRGLAHYDLSKNHWTNFSAFDSIFNLPTNQIQALCQTGETLLLGTWQGLVSLNLKDWSKGNFQSVPYQGNPHKIEESHITTFFAINDDSILVATWGGGLNVYLKQQNKNVDAETIFPELQELSSANIASVIRDMWGNFWINTFDKGLIVWNRNKESLTKIPSNYNDIYGIRGNRFNALLKDRNQNIWIGTDIGVSKFLAARSQFKVLRYVDGTSKGLSSSDIYAIVQDKNKNLWIGTSQGLNFFNHQTQKIKHYKHQNQRDSESHNNQISCLLIDSSNRLWIGHKTKSINLIDINTGKFLPERNDFPKRISSLFEDNQKNIWIGTMGNGLFVFDPVQDKIVKHYFNKKDIKGLSGNWIFSIAQDDDGFIYIGTWGAGLNRLDPKSEQFAYFNLIDPNNSLIKSKTVYYIFKGSNNLLYLGTEGGGLKIIDTKKNSIRHFTSLNGFPDNVIYGIAEDKTGNIWCGSNSGIIKLSPNHREISVFTQDDGIPNNEFNQNACFYDSTKNLIYFGGKGGVVYFNPQKIELNSPPLQVKILSFMINGNTVPIKNHLEEKRPLILSSKENNIAVQAGAVNFPAKEHLKVEIRLKGFESQWINADDKKTIIYSQIPVGNYTLQIRSLNKNDPQKLSMVNLAIYLRPPFYLTWWFKLLVVLLILSVILSFIIYRIYHLLALERLRAQIASDLHDEIGAGLTEISILNEILACKLPENWRKKVSKEFNQIGTVSRRLIVKMSDIVWLISPRHDSFSELISRLGDFVNRAAKKNNLQFTIENRSEIKNIKLNMQEKHDLFLLLKEALHNAVKHSQAKKIVLAFEIYKRNLIIQVIDDGIGFDVSNFKKGHGWQSMQERAKRLKAQLKVESAPNNSGTSLTLQTKIKR